VRSRYLVVLSILLIAGAVISWAYRYKIVSHLKSSGYLEYTPDEAVTLAYSKCGSCHSLDKVTKYCFRCGPPFIVVVHNMKTLIDKERGKPGKEGLPVITDAESVVIAQVWNALIGNWEEGWRKEDLKRLIKGDDSLIKLLDMPPFERKIEAALYKKSVPGAHKEGTFKPKSAAVK
jgi:hypothetical protein